MGSIRSVYESDPDMLEIVREFAAELPARVAKLEAHLSAGELRELQTLAHQLKGAGGGYGFPLITELAASLESALKQGADAPVVKDRAIALCETLRSVVVPEVG
jgi:HPt (histidine-containing phosphotransfer) domain-containing protein